MSRGELTLLATGHVEFSNTLRGHHATAEPRRGYTPREPRVLEAIPRAVFHVATMAHHHGYDGGPAAIGDTCDMLLANGMPTTGAGMSLDEAHTPEVLERDGGRVGFLSYNCVGPRASWAMYTKGAPRTCALSHTTRSRGRAYPQRQPIRSLRRTAPTQCTTISLDCASA